MRSDFIVVKAPDADSERFAIMWRDTIPIGAHLWSLVEMRRATAVGTIPGQRIPATVSFLSEASLTAPGAGSRVHPDWRRSSMRKLLALAILALMWAVPAVAHHSFAAEFDDKKPVTLKGKLTELEWLNPHGWIHL